MPLVLNSCSCTATRCNTLHNCNTMQQTATHCNMLQQITTNCNKLQDDMTARYSSLMPLVLTVAKHYNTLQHIEPYCNTLKRTETHCNLNPARYSSPIPLVLNSCNTLQHIAKHRIPLQHTATCCNAKQHTTTHCNTATQHTCALILADALSLEQFVPVVIFFLLRQLDQNWVFSFFHRAQFRHDFLAGRCVYT